MTNKEYEIRHQAMLETYECCCENCSKKYWECCIGVHMYFERVEGCKKALEKYAERYDKLSDFENGY